jgi:hypothetical protein
MDENIWKEVRKAAIDKNISASRWINNLVKDKLGVEKNE